MLLLLFMTYVSWNVSYSLMNTNPMLSVTKKDLPDMIAKENMCLKTTV